jgi:peptide/nickel transport system substrate-binding protein
MFRTLYGIAEQEAAKQKPTHGKESHVMRGQIRSGGRRARVPRFAAIVGSALLVSAVLAGVSASAPMSDAQSASSLRVAMAGPSIPFEPQGGNSDHRYMHNILDNVYETLVATGPNGGLVPLLASKMPVPINRHTWRIKIRSGISFSNGEPLNAAAVVYSIRRVNRPEILATADFRDNFEYLTGAREVDRLTVDVTTRSPFSGFLITLTTLRIMPPNYASRSNAFLTRPIGTGPYVLASGTGNGPFVLRANPRYWGPKPTITNVNVRVIPDPNTRISALRAGEVDLIADLSPDARASVPKVIATTGRETPTLSLNTRSGITADVRVRRALNYATNKTALLSLSAGLGAVPKCQFLTPAAFGHNPRLRPYPFDPGRARTLLSQAGASGRTITIAVAGFRFAGASDLAQAVAANWRAVGLNVNVQQQTTNDEFIGALNAKGDKRPDALYTPLTIVDLTTHVRFMLSDGALSSFSHPEVDAALRQGLRTLNTERRLALYQEALEVACNAAGFIHMVHPPTLWGASRRVSWSAPRADGAMTYTGMRVSG